MSKATTVGGVGRTTGRLTVSRVGVSLIRFGLLPLLLIAMVVVFAALSPQFLEVTNLLNVSRQSTYLLLVALGQMVVLLCGQLDLSVGATIAVTSVVTAQTTSALTNDPLLAVIVGIGVGLGVGLAVGLLNGVLVAFVRVPSFMVTLGTTSVLTGLALILSGGTPVSGVPLAFNSALATGSIFGVPIPIVVAVLLVAITAVVLNRTTFGRDIYAVGGNPIAAAVAGISVRKTLVLSFVVCSVLAATTGLLLTARVASGEATLGASYVMLSIAAAVLGGTSLFGGEGKIGLVVLGVIFLGVLSNGMNLLHISSYVQELVIGAVLVGAVAMERLRVHAV